MKILFAILSIIGFTVKYSIKALGVTKYNAKEMQLVKEKYNNQNIVEFDYFDRISLNNFKLRYKLIDIGLGALSTIFAIITLVVA